MTPPRPAAALFTPTPPVPAAFHTVAMPILNPASGAQLRADITAAATARHAGLHRVDPTLTQQIGLVADPCQVEDPEYTTSSMLSLAAAMATVTFVAWLWAVETGLSILWDTTALMTLALTALLVGIGTWKATIRLRDRHTGGPTPRHSRRP